ncbi:MAG: LamG-like jellyroll fold domain-containing protein [Candidatus Zixiibacteriota bacterium]
MMNKLNLLVILTLTLAVIIGGCSDKISDSNNTDVTIAFKSALGSQSSYFETSRFLLTVYIPEDEITNSYNLELVEGYIVGEITVKAGLGRVFTLLVRDTSVTPAETLFRGSRTINVIPGEPIELNIPVYPQVPMIKLSPIYEEVPVSISEQGFTFDVDVSVYNISSLGYLAFSLLSDAGSPYLFNLISTTIDPLLASEFSFDGYGSDNIGENIFYVSPFTGGTFEMVDDTGYAHLGTIRYRAQFTESAYEYGLSNIVFSYLNPLNAVGNEIDPATIDTVGITINRYNFDALIAGYWQMEQNPFFDTVQLDDASPNNLTTYAYFCDLDEWSYGYAAIFDGTSSYIEVTDKGELDIFDEITISMWLKTDSIAHMNETILSKRGTTGNINYEIRHSRDDISGDEFLYFASGTTECRIPVDFTDGWWHYVSLSHKYGYPNQIVWNIDGETLDAEWITGPGTDVPSGTFSNMQVGRYLYPTPGGYFTGSIDELRIVNKYFDEDYLIQFYTPIGK